MRKLFLILFVCVVSHHSIAQSLTLQQRLYYTCKVWGFAKYYHSNVSTCNVNWDSVLLHVLPLVKSAGTSADFNDALDTMLIAAGPMALSSVYFPDTIALELKRNRDWSWTSDPVFRTDIQTALDTIKNNFRPHTICSVEFDTSSTPAFGTSGGLLTFPTDSPFFLNVDVTVSYPDEYHRLLLLFKFWNIINYFNPHNYVLDKPVDTLLFNNVTAIDTVSSPVGLYNAIKRFTAGLDDAHTEGLTYDPYFTYPGQYVPLIMLRYIEGKYVVVKTLIKGVNIGDAIISVDGRTPAQIEDSFCNYVSTGNMSVFRRFMCQYLLTGIAGTKVNVVTADPTGTLTTGLYERSTQYFATWFPPAYYPVDSISSIKWTTLGCGIGYVNATNITTNDQADAAYAALSNSPAIILDLRNDATNSFVELVYDMFSGYNYCDKSKVPDVTYPGTFTWEYDTLYFDNTSSYKGTVILLFNEETQSHVEFYCMMFQGLPNVIKIGSQTAGTDGEITFFELTQDIHSGFTSVADFYANGDSTQRIGIVPDSAVYLTVNGIMQGRDELLDKAMQIGCSVAAVPNVQLKPAINVFPNPANDVIHIDNLQTNAIYVVYNILGSTVQEGMLKAGNNTLSLMSLANGMYLLEITDNEGRRTINKVAKQ